MKLGPGCTLFRGHLALPKDNMEPNPKVHSDYICLHQSYAA